MAKTWEELKKSKQQEGGAGKTGTAASASGTGYSGPSWSELKARKSGQSSIAPAKQEAKNTIRGLQNVTAENLFFGNNTFSAPASVPAAPAAPAAQPRPNTMRVGAGERIGSHVGAGSYAAAPVQDSFVGPLNSRQIRENEPVKQERPLRDLTDYAAQMEEMRRNAAQKQGSRAEELFARFAGAEKIPQAQTPVQTAAPQTAIAAQTAALGLPDLGAPRGTASLAMPDGYDAFVNGGLAPGQVLSQREGISPAAAQAKQPARRVGAGEAVLMDPQEIGYENLRSQPDFAEIAGREIIVPPEKHYSESDGSVNMWHVEHMTDDQKAMYNYIAHKYGFDEADKYFRTIEEEVNERMAGGVVQSIEGLPPVAQQIFEGAYAAGRGLGGAVEGYKTLPAALRGEETVAPKSQGQHAYEMMYNDKGFLGRLGMDLAYTAGNQVPQILLSLIMGTPGTKMAKIAQMGISGINTASTVLGSRYAEGIRAGKSPNVARRDAILSASLEALTEAIGGNRFLSAGTLTDARVDKIVGAIDGAFGRFAARTGFDAFGEATEEALTGILEPVILRFAFGEDEEVNWGDIAYQALVGGLSGALMGGPGNAAVSMQEAREKSAQAAATSVLSEETTPEQKHNAAKTALEIAGVENAEGLADTVVQMANGEEVAPEALEAVAMTDGALEVVKAIAATKVDQKTENDQIELDDELIEEAPEGLEGEELDAWVNRQRAIGNAAKLGGERRIHEEIYDMGGGQQNAAEYSTEYERAYNRGRNNMPMSDEIAGTYKTLTAEQTRAAWNEGSKAYRAEQQRAPVQAAESMNGRKGYIDTSAIRNERLTSDQKSAVRASRYVAEALGIKVVWYASKTDAEGKRTEANGFFDPKDRSIHLDVYAGVNTAENAGAYRYAAMRTFSHELTHYIEDQSPVLYGKLRDMVFSHLAEKGIDVESLIDEKAQRAPGISRFEATQEVVADACEMMLRDSKAVKAAAMRDASLWQQIKERFAKFVADLRAAFDRVEAVHPEAKELMKDFEGVLRYTEDLQKAWDDALLSATSERQNDQKAEEVDQKAEEAEQEAEETEQTKSAADQNGPETEQPGEVAERPEEQQEPNRIEKQRREGVTLMEDRSWESIKDRSMRPFAEEVPEVREWFAMAAELLQDDLAQSTAGQKIYIPMQGNEPGTVNVTGQKRSTVDEIAELLGRGMTYRNISDALDAYAQTDMDWIRKHPQTAKKVELMLDQVLMEGYTNIEGEKVLGVEDYKALMDELAGREPKKPVEYDLGEDMRFSVRYDYTKPFAEQVEDWKNGKLPKRINLIVGTVPEVLQKIGIAKVPMVMGQGHVYKALHGDADHVFAEGELENLPVKIADPIAIIASETHPDTSLVAIIDAVSKSGKQGIAAVYINGSGKVEGLELDAIAVTSVHGHSNTVEGLLKRAIENDGAEMKTLYYWNKKEAVALMQRAGLQLPTAHLPQNGFVHSILEEGSPVKPDIKNQTQTQQFKRWFGESKIVNPDGTPKVLYHQTNAEFTVFDTQRQGAGYNDSEMPSGIYMKETPDTIKLGTDFENSHQMPLYVRMEMPLYLLDREQANKHWQKHVPDYEQMQSELDELNAKYEADYDEADMLWEGDTDEDWEKWDAETSRIMEEWKAAENGKRRQMKEAIDAWLEDSQYDGIVMMQDKGTGGTVKTYVVLKNTQVKSATRNKGFFDPQNEDIRYSAREPVTDSESFREWFGDSEIVNEDGSPKVMYHGTPYGGFTVFRDWQYFTDNKEYADVYQSPSASSIRGKYNPATNPQTYEVYLRVEKPFDTRKPEIRRLWQKEFYGKWGDGTPLSDRGLPDWTEGIDLIEWIEENEYDFDAILLDEGGTGGYGEEVRDRGVSVVVRNSYQVKSATENVGTYSRESNDIRYQPREEEYASNREILANALEGAAQTVAERNRIAEYKMRIRSLDIAQNRVSNIREEITEVNKMIKEAKGAEKKKLTERLENLQAQKNTLEREINETDKVLLKLEATEPLKLVVNRERKAAMDKVRTKAADSRSKDKYKQRIAQKVAALTVQLTKPTTKKYIPEPIRGPVADFLSSVRFTSQRQLKGGEPTKKDMKLAESLAALQRVMLNVKSKQNENTADAVQNGFGMYIDLPDGFIQTLTALSDQVAKSAQHSEEGYNVNMMSTAQLKALDAIITSLNESIKNVNKFLSENLYRHIDDAARDTIWDLGQIRAREKSTKIGQFLEWDNALPVFAFDRLGRGGRAIFKGLMRGQDKLAQNADQVIKYAESVYDEAELKAWEEDVREFTFDEETIRIPVAHIMSLYCLMKREQAMGHLHGEGFRVGDYTIKGTTYKDKGHVTSDQMMTEIVSVLSDRQKQVADKLQNYMSTVGAEWGNYVSMRRFGYEAFGENFYFPIESDSRHLSAVSEDGGKGNPLYALLNIGPVQELTPKANNRLVLHSIFDVYSKHMSEMAQYNALALPLLDAIKWLNYRETSNLPGDEKETKRTMSIQDVIVNAYGMQGRGYVIRMLEDISGRKATVDEDKTFGKMLGRMNRAQVAFNLRVALLQPLSIFRAAMTLNAVPTMQGVLKNFRKLQDNIEEMEQYSGIAKWKALGFREVNVSRGVLKLIKHDYKATDKIVEKSMAAAEAMDKLTWSAIWEVCKIQTAKSMNPGSEGYMEAVRDLFEETIYRTQVVDSVLTKTQYMRTPAGMNKWLSSFMSEPSTTYNMLADAVWKVADDARVLDEQKAQELGVPKISRSEHMSNVGKAMKENAPRIGRTVGVYAMSAVATTLIEGLMSAWRDDDDYEKFTEQMFDGFWWNLFENMNPIAMLPIGSQLWEGTKTVLENRGLDVYGYDMSNPINEAFQSVIGIFDAWDRYAKGTGTGYNVLYKSAQMLSSITGLPFANGMREVVSLWNNSVASWNPQTRIQTYKTPDAKGAAAYLKAVKANNDRLAAEMIEEMEANGVSGKAREKAMTSAVKEAYKSGGMDSAEAARMLEKYGGYADTKDDRFAAERLVREWEVKGESGKDSQYAWVWGYISDWDGKALQQEVKELRALGVKDSSIAASVTSHFKDEYLSATGKEKADLKAHLITAFTYMGMTSAEAKKKVESWEEE